MKSLSTALVTIRRSPYQSLAAILILTLTFFVGYTFSLFVVGSEYVLRFFETRPQVIAFFQLDTDETEVKRVSQDLDKKDYVTAVKVVSKDEALKLYQEENKDDPLLLELVTAQILPASIEVSGRTVGDLPQIKKDLDGISSIDEVVLQQDIIDSLASWTQAIRIVGVASVVLLAVTSLVIMMVVIGMKAVNKRPAIQIMRIIGATRWFVQSPFIFEGMVYGFLSSLIGWGFMYGGLLYLTPWLQEFLGTITLFPIPWQFFAIQIGIGTLAGMVLGAWAGSLAVGRIMKK